MANYEVVDNINPNTSAVTAEFGPVNAIEVAIFDRALRNDLKTLGNIDNVSRPIRQRNIEILLARCRNAMDEIMKRAREI